MFDIGWAELLIIAIVALIVVGPKDLPGMFRTVGQFMGRARSMAREFQRSMEQAADESGLKEATDGLKSASRYTRSPTRTVRTFAEKTVGNPFGADDGTEGAATAGQAGAADADGKQTAQGDGPGPGDTGTPAPAEQPPAEAATGTGAPRPAGGRSGTSAGS